MFAFFRRYQRIFFILTTVVIVFSFSFFGTYSTFTAPQEDNSVVFVAIDGSKVRRPEFMEYVHFLSSELQDLYGTNQSRFNPANNGIITNQILQKGLGEAIFKNMKNGQAALMAALEVEKTYTPFTHPQYPFIGLEGIWSYFAPDLATSYSKYRQEIAKNGVGDELFTAKVKLYCAQKQFPATLAQQVIQYQLAQMGAPQAGAIDTNRLAIFGYDTIQEWFGSAFVDACVVWIYNSAREAEAQGIEVSNREALFIMLQGCKELLQREPRLKKMGYQQPGQLFIDTLHRIGLDEAAAVRVMRDVLLSEKLFERVGTAVPVAPALFTQLTESANKFVELTQYTLPKALQVNSQEQMAQVQIWIDAVRKDTPSSSWEAILSLPKETKSPHELAKTCSELVQREFRVRWSSIDADNLAEAIPLRQVWAWQTSDAGWKQLSSQFSDLPGQSELAHRLKVLDALPAAKREEIELYSRKHVLQQHPNRVRQALAQVEMQQAVLSLRQKGSLLPFNGISNFEELKQLLSNVVIGESDPRVEAYTQDGRYYTRLIVLDRESSDEVVPLAKALEDGTLKTMLDEALKVAYLRLRSQTPKTYLQENGDWKPLSAVQETVLEHHFRILFSALDQAREVYKPQFPDLCNWERSLESRLAIRFMPYMKQIWDRIQKDAGLISQYVNEGIPLAEMDVHPLTISLQWKLDAKNTRVIRKEGSPLFTFKLLEGLPLHAWVPLRFSMDTGLAFAHVQEVGLEPVDQDRATRVLGCYHLLGAEVAKSYAVQLMAKMDFSVEE